MYIVTTSFYFIKFKNIFSVKIYCIYALAGCEVWDCYILSKPAQTCMISVLKAPNNHTFLQWQFSRPTLWLNQLIVPPPSTPTTSCFCVIKILSYSLMPTFIWLLFISYFAQKSGHDQLCKFLFRIDFDNMAVKVIQSLDPLLARYDP